MIFFYYSAITMTEAILCLRLGAELFKRTVATYIIIWLTTMVSMTHFTPFLYIQLYIQFPI